MMITWLMRIAPLPLHVEPSLELTGCIQTFDDNRDQTGERYADADVDDQPNSRAGWLYPDLG